MLVVCCDTSEQSRVSTLNGCWKAYLGVLGGQAGLDDGLGGALGVLGRDGGDEEGDGEEELHLDGCCGGVWCSEESDY